MAKKKVGERIKEARTKAGLSQTALAAEIDGVSASDIGKAERGEKELTQAQLKAIAKATGVTQKSLLEAAGESSSKKPSAGKSGSSAKSAATTSLNVTAEEKKLVQLYRKADADTRAEVMKLLKADTAAGDLGGLLESLLGEAAGGTGKKEELIGSLLGNAMDMIMKKDN